jgi:hypothetical protein
MQPTVTTVLPDSRVLVPVAPGFGNDDEVGAMNNQPIGGHAHSDDVRASE